MRIIFDAELFNAFLANSIIQFQGLQKNFEEYYETDKYRFYERAKNSNYYNHHILSDQTIESVVAMKRVFGILLCAEDDECVRDFVFKNILNTDNRFKDLVKNPKWANVQKFIDSLWKNRAKSIYAEYAPLYFLAYLFYSTYGTDSDNEIVNGCLEYNHEIILSVSSHKPKSIAEIMAHFDMEKIMVPKKIRAILNSLTTGLDIASFLDTMRHGMSKTDAKLSNPELYGYIRDYNSSGDDESLDIRRANSIASVATIATSVNGIDLINGAYGHIRLTKEEQKFIIQKLTKGTAYNYSGVIDVSTYLAGFIIVLLTNEIRNIKEFYFKNNSETQYLELQRLENVINDKEREIERLKAELTRSNEQNEQQRDEIKQLTDELFKENKEAVKPYASEISGLNGRIRELEKALEAEQAKAPELNALREFAFAAQSEYVPPETTVTLAELIRGKKIIIVGGHINWRNKMKEKYSAITLLDGHNLSLDNSIFDKTDLTLLYLYTSNMSHKLYYKVIDYLRNRDIRIDYLGRSKNPELLEAEIASILKAKAS